MSRIDNLFKSSYLSSYVSPQIRDQKYCNELVEEVYKAIAAAYANYGITDVKVWRPSYPHPTDTRSVFECAQAKLERDQMLVTIKTDHAYPKAKDILPPDRYGLDVRYEKDRYEKE